MLRPRPLLIWASVSATPDDAIASCRVSVCTRQVNVTLGQTAERRSLVLLRLMGPEDEGAKFRARRVQYQERRKEVGGR